LAAQAAASYVLMELSPFTKQNCNQIIVKHLKIYHNGRIKTDEG
jgi:hypothetical protein